MPSSTVRTRRRNYTAIIRLADPNFERDKRKELEYEFGKGSQVERKFYGNPATRGPYDGQ